MSEGVNEGMSEGVNERMSEGVHYVCHKILGRVRRSREKLTEQWITQPATLPSSWRDNQR